MFERESELRCVLDHMPAMIGFWDRDLRNGFANSAYLEWFGIEPERIPGMHLREVIGEERYRLNLPYVQAALRGESQTFERVIPTPDGSRLRYSLANYIPYRRDGVVHGFFALVSDITAIKETEAALRASEERYRDVVEDQTEVISRIRRDGTFTFVNDVYCRFFGKPADELVGSKWQPTAYAEDMPLIEAQLRRLSVDQPTVTVENRVYAADGGLRWMQFINRGFFADDGTLVEIQSVGRDISERKQIEAQLREARDELEARVAQRTEQLRKLSIEAMLTEERERQAIARDLHDELGQVLHVARIRIDSLAKSLPAGFAGQLAELGELIADASSQVRSLTSQLSPPVLRRLGLGPALGWLCDEIERQYGLPVRADIAPAGEELATLSRAQSGTLFRAVRELLINVTKHARATHAGLTVARTDAGLQLTVEDDGIGMTEQSALAGTGAFGLFSVRERVLHLGGTLTIDNAPHGGTRVTICMPVDFAGIEAAR